MADIRLVSDSDKLEIGGRDGGDLNLYHNSTNSFIENETGILYVTNKANANMVLGTNNSARLTIEADGTVVTSGALQPGGNVTIAGNLTVNGTGSDVITGDYLYLDAADNSAAKNLVFRQLNDTWLGQIEFHPSSTSQIVTRVNQPLAFGVNNSQKMTIDTDGNIGIGIADALVRLDVRNTTNTIALNTTAGAVFESASPDANNGTYLFGDGSGDSDRPQILAVNSGAAGASIWSGIGFGLKYSGNTVVTLAGIAGIKENSTDGSGGDVGALGFGTRATGDYIKERMRITSAGHVGIGSSSVTDITTVWATGTVLDVHESSGSDTGAIILSGDTTTNGGGVGSLVWANRNNSGQASEDAGAEGKGIGIIVTNVVTSDSNSGDDSGGDMKFFTKPEAGTITERMRINSAGRVLVGSGAIREMSGVSSQFQVEGTSYDTSSMSLVGNTGTSSGAAPIIFFGRSRGTSDGSSTVAADGDRLGALFFCGADGTDINTVAASIDVEVDGTPGGNDMPGRIVFKTNSGTSAATARWNIPATGNIIPEADNTYNIGSSARQVSVLYTANSVVVSDETKKENIKDCDLGIDFVNTLKPKSYNIKNLEETHDDYNKKHYGLIAQDLKDGKLKDSVFGDKDGEYGLNYNDLIAPLIKAVQELSAKVEKLKGN